ncbi:hypothetical protein [Paraburkholderia pallida]|uniref:Uncharacterized protein n=1 Tax=Paraburkholderia pallida TaxID=2547399 RepID=A0A4P7CVA7_9BURK|nr:hypothetical protein [Paraburkholderia pallida]QBQ99237.1 hypothetical protein E1956_18710 [Paraburkholderia pallida]
MSEEQQNQSTGLLGELRNFEQKLEHALHLDGEGNAAGGASSGRPLQGEMSAQGAPGSNGAIEHGAGAAAQGEIDVVSAGAAPSGTSGTTSVVGAESGATPAAGEQGNVIGAAQVATDGSATATSSDAASSTQTTQANPSGAFLGADPGNATPGQALNAALSTQNQSGSAPQGDVGELSLSPVSGDGNAGEAGNVLAANAATPTALEGSATSATSPTPSGPGAQEGAAGGPLADSTPLSGSLALPSLSQVTGMAAAGGEGDGSGCTSEGVEAGNAPTDAGAAAAGANGSAGGGVPGAADPNGSALAADAASASAAALSAQAALQAAGTLAAKTSAVPSSEVRQHVLNIKRLLAGFETRTVEQILAELEAIERKV